MHASEAARSHRMLILFCNEKVTVECIILICILLSSVDDGWCKFARDRSSAPCRLLTHQRRGLWLGGPDGVLRNHIDTYGSECSKLFCARSSSVGRFFFGELKYCRNSSQQAIKKTKGFCSLRSGGNQQKFL